MQVILFCSPISSVLFDHLEELLSSANCFNTAKNYLLTLISNGISVSDTSVRSGIDLSFNFATNLSFSASGISSADFETIQIALLGLGLLIFLIIGILIGAVIFKACGDKPSSDTKKISPNVGSNNRLIPTTDRTQVPQISSHKLN